LLPATLKFAMIKSFDVRICLILSLLLLCINLLVHSQTLISLGSRKGTIKDPRFYISEIVDARSNKDIVGIVQRGLNNKQEIAQFKSGFQVELKNALTEFLQPQSNLTPMVVRVLKLNVFERTLLTSESAIAEVIVEFYTKTDAGITLVKSAASTVTSDGIDVTRSHGRNIERCLTDCLSQLNTFLLHGPPTFDMTSNIEHKKLFETPDALKDYNYGILIDKSPVKGVYRNFIEFRDNAPGIIMDFSIKEKPNYTGEAYDATRGVVKTADGKQSNVWGYSDGKRIFLKVGQEFFQIFSEDGILWFEGYDISGYKTDVAIPGKSVVMGALTGYFFYSVQVSLKSRKVRYAINMGNGDLIPLD
jgi:hypothetical protein